MKEKKEPGLKSALDLAMERLGGGGGAPRTLSDEQKRAIADIEKQAKAKIAEIEILMGKRIGEAREKGDAEELQKIEEQKRVDVARVRDRAESDKERVRDGQ